MSDANSIVVPLEGLKPLNPRPGLFEYVQQLWVRRFFIIAEARSKALRSTRDYRLWKLWLIVNPILGVIFYGFLFGVLFRTSRGVENFVGYLFLGMIFMQMMTGLFSAGSGLIRDSRAMIQAFAFPRAALVFSQTLRAAIDNLLPALVAIVLAFLTQWGKPPTWTTLLVIPLYIMIHLFGCGLMFLTARITAELPDTKALVGITTQAWFFLSGVMFSLDRFDHVSFIQSIMFHNPGYVFLTAIRNTTIYGTVPDLQEWGIMLVWTLGTLLVGFLFFWRAEQKYVRLA
ncbi:ABC transporter permease [Corynebacterium sp. NML120713]|uniref:ABC transporter permease n=1 Tax=Corynebacterium sp. NML120713 TaxID=1906332 RepID=UPI000AF85006|nr:ABC transporter permease [Corynebacterium sp. NML120713]